MVRENEEGETREEKRRRKGKMEGEDSKEGVGGVLKKEGKICTVNRTKLD